MKKEPCWNLTINTEAGDAPKSTPRQRVTKGTPKKATKADNGSGGSHASDDDEDTFTPSKKAKTPLNKVKNGRVTKPRGKTGAQSFTEDDDDDDELAVKGEDDNMEFNNGQSYGYQPQGNGNGQ
jgi:hypothetical protein